MTQEAGLQEAEYAYERISADRDALVRKGLTRSPLTDRYWQAKCRFGAKHPH
jgi:hypothetical protein